MNCAVCLDAIVGGYVGHAALSHIDECDRCAFLLDIIFRKQAYQLSILYATSASHRLCAVGIFLHVMKFALFGEREGLDTHVKTCEPCADWFTELIVFCCRELHPLLLVEIVDWNNVSHMLLERGLTTRIPNEVYFRDQMCYYEQRCATEH